MLCFTKGCRSEFSCRRRANSSLQPSIGPEIHLWNRAERPMWWPGGHAFGLPALRAAVLMSNAVSQRAARLTRVLHASFPHAATSCCPRGLQTTLTLPLYSEKGFCISSCIIYLNQINYRSENQNKVWERRLWSRYSLNKFTKLQQICLQAASDSIFVGLFPCNQPSRFGSFS